MNDSWRNGAIILLLLFVIAVCFVVYPKIDSRLTTLEQSLSAKEKAMQITGYGVEFEDDGKAVIVPKDAPAEVKKTPSYSLKGEPFVFRFSKYSKPEEEGRGK